MTQHAHKIALEDALKIKKQALQYANNYYESILNRLLNLQKHNPHITDHDFDVQKQRQKKTENLINTSMVKLDSIRFILAVS